MYKNEFFDNNTENIVDETGNSLQNRRNAFYQSRNTNIYDDDY
jgi:hypothetical protein